METTVSAVTEFLVNILIGSFSLATLSWVAVGVQSFFNDRKHEKREQEKEKRFVFKDGRREERTWKDRSRADSWTPEMKEKARQRTLENQRRKKQWEQQPVRSR